MGKVNWRKWTAERLSTRLLYVLVALCMATFAMYWFVAYTRPFDENPNFNAPLFTDAVIVLGYLLVLGTGAVAVWSVVRSLKIRGKSEAYSNNVPVKQLGYGVAGGTALLLLLTFLVGSSAEMQVNGTRFSDVFWLKTSDMLISTSLILLVVAVGSVIYGATKYIRRK